MVFMLSSSLFSPENRQKDNQAQVEHFFVLRPKKEHDFFYQMFFFNKILEYRIEFQWCMCRHECPVRHHWFSWGLDIDEETSHYLKQKWPGLMTYMCVTRPQRCKQLLYICKGIGIKPLSFDNVFSPDSRYEHEKNWWSSGRSRYTLSGPNPRPFTSTYILCFLHHCRTLFLNNICRIPEPVDSSLLIRRPHVIHCVYPIQQFYYYRIRPQVCLSHVLFITKLRSY